MTQQLAKTAKGVIEYRLEGAGPTVMVLQGGHCSRASRFSHELLATQGFTVLTPSRPGYDSTPVDVGKTAQAAADALAALLDTLQIPSVDLIGISAAGPTALAFAQRHPGKLRKLVLESAMTTPWDEATKRGARLLFGRAEKFTWALTKAALRLAPLAIIRTLLQEMTTLPIDEVMERLSQADRLFVRRMIETSQSGTGFTHDLEHQVTNLGTIGAPVLVIYSPHDKTVPPCNAQRIAAEVPQAELFATPADTHLIWVGAYAPAVWQKRLAFLGA